MFNVPFSGNPEVIDLVQARGLERFQNTFQTGLCPPLYWKDPLFTPGQTIQKMHWILQVGGEKESVFLVLGQWSLNLCTLPFWSQLLRQSFVFFALSFQNSMHSNYRPKFIYFCLLSFSRYNILYRTLLTLGAKAFKSLPVGYLTPSLRG